MAPQERASAYRLTPGLTAGRRLVSESQVASHAAMQVPLRVVPADTPFDEDSSRAAGRSMTARPERRDRTG